MRAHISLSFVPLIYDQVVCSNAHLVPKGESLCFQWLLKTTLEITSCLHFVSAMSNLKVQVEPLLRKNLLSFGRNPFPLSAKMKFSEIRKRLIEKIRNQILNRENCEFYISYNYHIWKSTT